MIDKYQKYLKDKDLMKKIFSSKSEMSKQCYKIVLTYIRKIRAFIFKQPQQLPVVNDDSTQTSKTLAPEDIPILLDEIFKLFEQNREISVSKLGKISKALDFCLKRLNLKLEADSKLQESEYFKNCLEKLQKLAQDFEERLKPK